MTPPSLHVRALGHAAVVLPTTALFLFSLYMLSQDTRTWPAALVFGLTLNKVMQANAASEAYKAWKRGWDAMSPVSAAPKRSVKHVFAVVLTTAAMLGLYALSETHGMGAAIGVTLILLAPVALVATLVKLWRWSRRRRRATTAMPVTVCVTRPLLPVPDLQSAYRRLPEHCARILHSAP